jgi:hypothetical protein
MHCTSSKIFKAIKFHLHGQVLYMQKPSVQHNLTIQFKDWEFKLAMSYSNHSFSTLLILAVRLLSTSLTYHQFHNRRF